MLAFTGLRELLLQEHNMRYILGVKEGDHAFLFERVAQAERADRVKVRSR